MSGSHLEQCWGAPTLYQQVRPQTRALSVAVYALLPSLCIRVPGLSESMLDGVYEKASWNIRVKLFKIKWQNGYLPFLSVYIGASDHT